MAAPARPALTISSILPHLRIGRLTGIAARLPAGVGEARRDILVLKPGSLPRLGRSSPGRRFLLTDVPTPPGPYWLCCARVLAGRAAVGALGWPPESLLAWCDRLLIPLPDGDTLHYSCAGLRRSACLRLVGHGPGPPPLAREGTVRPLGAGRVEAILPLAGRTAEEILSTWLVAEWRVEASTVIYPALAAVLDRAGSEDSFPAPATSPDRYRYGCRDAPPDAP